MVDEDEIKFSMIPHEVSQCLKHSDMDDDPVSEACVLMDLVGYICNQIIRFNCMDDCLGVGGHEKCGETAVPTKFQYIFWGCFLEEPYQDVSFLLAYVHHPILLAKLVD
jgi:hypothetical protein